MTSVIWQTSAYTWPAVAVGTGACAVVALLGLRQSKAVPRWARVTLPALRLMALAALMGALFQPLLSWSDNLTSGRVVAVLFDTSRSMDTKDDIVSPGAALRLADGLGLLAEGGRNNAAAVVAAELAAVRSRLDSLREISEEIDYSRLAGRPVEEAAGRLAGGFSALAGRIDTLATTADTQPHATALREFAAYCRAETPDVRAAARRADVLLADLAKTEDAIDVAFIATNASARAAADRVRDVNRLELARLASRRGPDGVLAALSTKAEIQTYLFSDELLPAPNKDPLDDIPAAGWSTDLDLAVDSVIGRVPAGRLDAVVVFTDGRAAPGRGAASSSVVASGVPVFPVLVGSAKPRRDARVIRFDAPSTAMVGETIVARVDLQTSGLPAGLLTVRLSAGEDQQTQSIETDGADTRTIEFPVRVKQKGDIAIKVVLDRVDGDATINNNSAVRTVRVVSGKLKAAVLWGSAGWDLQYLRNALSRVEWVELSEQHLPAGTKCGLTPDRLLEQDLIVLCDVQAASLSQAQVEAIHKHVQDRAGGVLLLAGDVAVLKQYAQDPLLSSLLPYRLDGEPIWRVWPGETSAFIAVPAKNAPPAEWLRLDETPDASVRKWLARPTFFRVLSLPQLKPNARPLLVDRDSQAPMMIESASGGGRTLMVAIDETWRWRRVLTGAVHDRFWLSVARYCIDPPYAASAGALSLDVDRTEITPGEPVRIRARVGITSTDRKPGSSIGKLEIVRDGQSIETRELKELLPGSHRFESVLTDIKPGKYDVKFSAGDWKESVTLPLEVSPTADRELLNVSTDPQLLQRLATVTGGKMVTLEKLRDLPALIAAGREGRVGRTEYAVWCSPYLFIFVLGCLGCEWALRKRVGLV